MKISKIVALFAQAYTKFPFQPFKKSLRKLYLNYLISAKGDKTLMEKIDGIMYELDLSELIDSAIYFRGAAEQGTANVLKFMCNKGFTVFDIGANVGSHTLPIAKFIGDSGIVYAFEPVPWALKKLRRNISLNAYKNIVVEPIGLSDAKNEAVECKFRASFKVSSKSTGAINGNLNQEWMEACDDVIVDFQTIDSYVDCHKISKIDLIKLDVDGYEAKVIRGGESSIKRFNPIIVMEIAPDWARANGEDIRETIEFLVGVGYVFSTEEFMPVNDILNAVSLIPSGKSINVLASIPA